MENLILAFVAGFALNFMPCILPILLIKIYDIVKYSQTTKNKKNLKLISLATSLGIILVFSIFSIITILFKNTGKNFNIGFHFQNPYFLILTIFVLFLFLLNLLNFFNFHYSPKLINYIQKRYNKTKQLNKSIFFENFITGVFMVLFATPCLIPIIGTIATLSLIIENDFIILSNFIVMGLGMAFPFLIIIVYPNLLTFLKNQKNLLKYIHYMIIISLTTTIIWLLYVLISEITLKPTIFFLLFLIISAIQFKIIKNKFQNLIIMLFILISSTILPISIFRDEEAIKINNSLWKTEITQEEIEEYIKNEKTVFINISAQWCIICNLNNITVFSKYKVVNYLKNENIISVRIDATQNNDKIKIFYDDPNKLYMPKYIIYNKNHIKGCSFTGQITQKDFFKEIEKCK